MRAAAEPLPDEPDDRRGDEMQVTRIPDSSKVSIYPVCEVMGKERLTGTPRYQYRDPLSGVLDYIIEVRPGMIVHFFRT